MVDLRKRIAKEDGGETLKTLFKLVSVDAFNTYSLFALMQLIREPIYNKHISSWLESVLPIKRNSPPNIAKGIPTQRDAILSAFNNAVKIADFICGDIAKFPMDLYYPGFPSWLPEQDHHTNWSPGKPPYLLFLDLLRIWRSTMGIVFYYMLNTPEVADQLKFFYLKSPKVLLNQKYALRASFLTYPTAIFGEFQVTKSDLFKELSKNVDTFIKVQLSSFKSKEVVYYFDKVLKRDPASYTKEEELYHDMPNLHRLALQRDLEPNNEALVYMGDAAQNAALVRYCKIYNEKVEEINKAYNDGHTIPKSMRLQEYLDAGAKPIPHDDYPPYVSEFNLPLSFNKCYFIQKEPNVNNVLAEVYLDRARYALKNKYDSIIELTREEKKQALSDGMVMKALYYAMGKAWSAWQSERTFKNMINFIAADLAVFNKAPLPENWPKQFRGTWFAKRMALILDIALGEYAKAKYDVNYFSSVDLSPFHRLMSDFRFSSFIDVVELCFSHNIDLPDLLANNRQIGSAPRVPLAQIEAILCEIQRKPVDTSKPPVVPWETSSESGHEEFIEEAKKKFRDILLRSL
jgi:hypothetical protein